MDKKTVIVTGQGGQAGQYLIKYLLENEPELRIIGTIRHKSYDDQEYIFDRNLITTELMDLSDSHSIETLILKYKPDYFINTAANAFVGESWSVPAQQITLNCLGVLHQLEAIKKHSRHTRYYNFGCHDTETKVVTPDGIKNYKEIKEGDLLYTLNERTSELELKPVKRIVEYDYKGDMYLFKWGRLCLTPNHNVIYKQKAKKDKILRKQCRDFIKLSYGFYPVNKPKKGEKLPESFDLRGFIRKQSKKGNKNYGKHVNFINSYDLMYLIGLYLGDGSSRIMEKKYQRKYKIADGRKNDWEDNALEDTVYYCPQTVIDIPKSDKAFNKLTNVLDKNGIKWNLYGQCDVTFHQWGLHEIFDECGHSASTKTIPKWIFNLDYSYLVKVLEGILDSDGADNGTITTASKQLQDDISKLMILCGKNPANYERPARKMYFKSEDRFIVGKYPEYGVRAYTENRGYRRNAFTLAKYDGKVWCLEMEDNHNFLVYRNGAYTFSGNTSEEFGCVVNNGPQNEETKIAPRSPYGCAKAAARYLVNTYRESFNLYCIQGWSFNFESKLRGSKYLTKKVTENVARIYHSIKRNNWNFEPLRVGNIYTYRSWQHASDVADGVWRMLNQDKFRTDWQNRQGVTLPKEIKQYVLSESETHSAKEFIQKAFLEAGIEGVWGNKTTEVIDEKFLLLKDNQTIPLVEISKEFFRPSDVTFLFGDSTLARKELGWSPKISFDEIIKEMVRADIKRQEFKN